jgi:hypothetical protein
MTEILSVAEQLLAFQKVIHSADLVNYTPDYVKKNNTDRIFKILKT